MTIVSSLNRGMANTAGSPIGGTTNLVARDANGNTAVNNLSQAVTGYAASGTITLTNASSRFNVFSSGSGSATVVLPDATTLLNGTVFEFNNNASGVITVQENGGSGITSMAAGSYLKVILLSNSFAAGQWDYHWLLPSSYSAGTASLNVGKTASVSAGSYLLTGSSTGTISILGQAAAGTYNFNLPTTAGTSSYLLTSAGGSSSAMTWTAPASLIQIVPYTGVNHAASPYTVLSTDYYLSCDVTGGVISILLPNAPSTGTVYIIKDKVGLSATSNITITTVGGSVNIDGATTYTMNTNYAAIDVIFNGTSYEVY